MTAVYALAGLGLVAITLTEAFEVLVLPRQVTRSFRFARFYYRSGWRVWTALVRVLPAQHRRSTFLSAFGPLSLLGLFSVWATGMVVGFGLLHHGIDPRDSGLG